MKKFAYISSLALALVCCGAQAAQSAADRLAELQSQKALKKLEAEIAEQEAKARELRKGSGGQGSATSTGTPGESLPDVLRRRSQAKPGAVQDDALPTLVSIAGVDDQFRAVVMSGGQRKTVREGDVLSGGWVLRKLERSTATVARGNQTLILKPQ